MKKFFKNNVQMIKAQLLLGCLFVVGIATAFISLEFNGRTSFMVSDWSLIFSIVMVFIIGFIQMKRDSLD